MIQLSAGKALWMEEQPMLNSEVEAQEKEEVDTDIVEGEHGGTEQVERALQAFARTLAFFLGGMRF